MILLMDIDIIWYAVVVLAGLLFGSFAGASVWRLRAYQLVEDKKVGEPYDEKEYERLVPLTKSKLASDRSQCLECGHTLRWYDLLPLVSWLRTKGKCAYCGKPIGWFEPVVELVTAGLFLSVYQFSLVMGYGIGPLLLLLAITLGLVILFFYDLKWLLLPNAVMWSVIGLSGVWWVWLAVNTPDLLGLIGSTVASVMTLSGLYLLLWLVSKGQWVGFGDVKLGLALGLLLANDWRLALLTLFLANFIGTLIVLPGLLSRKIGRQSHVPFGPLLIAGFFISLFFGTYIANWYASLAWYGF
jgi:prepilin signal peptidase PulO-like enzyme (type II secretory pathway)